MIKISFYIDRYGHIKDFILLQANLIILKFQNFIFMKIFIDDFKKIFCQCHHLKLLEILNLIFL